MSTPPEFPEHGAPLGLPPDTDETRERYVGLYTRVIAFVLDAARINRARVARSGRITRVIIGPHGPNRGHGQAC